MTFAELRTKLKLALVAIETEIVPPKRCHHFVEYGLQYSETEQTWRDAVSFQILRNSLQVRIKLPDELLEHSSQKIVDYVSQTLRLQENSKHVKTIPVSKRN